MLFFISFWRATWCVIVAAMCFIEKNLFLKFSTEWRRWRRRRARKKRNNMKNGEKKYGHIRKCFVVVVAAQHHHQLYEICARERERERARLIFISEIYVYSMYLSVCFAYFFLLLSLCTLFKNKLPVFSAILAHTRSPTVLRFYCVELLIKWYFRNFHGQHSNMNCEYVRVHIEHITNSMWLNWLEYSYLFQDTHFTAQAVPANEHGLRCPYACFIEFQWVFSSQRGMLMAYDSKFRF